MTTIAVGQRFDAAFGRYRVRRIDGDTIVMVDVDRPSASVMPTRDRIGPGLNFWPVDDDASPVVASAPGEDAATARPPGDAAAPAPASASSSSAPATKPTKTAKPSSLTLGEIAYKAWLVEHCRPRPTEAEACPYMARLGRFRCAFTACVPACPRSGQADAAAPTRNADPPPLTALELRSIWARVGGTLAPVADVVQERTAAVVLQRHPANDREDYPAASDSSPAAAPASTNAAAPVDAGLPAPADEGRAPYPGCVACGAVRTIMLVLAPGLGDSSHATICSRCYQGSHDREKEYEVARHRFRRFFGREP